jgi:hypothetical protein
MSEPLFADDRAPRVISAPGELPDFWDRDAVFVANLLGLFFGNETQTRELAREVGEVDSYGGRLVPVLDLLFRGRGRNLLVLEREPDAALCRYFEEVAGLSLPERCVLSHADYLKLGAESGADDAAARGVLQRIGAHPAAWVDGYVTDEILARVSQEVGKRTVASPEGSRRGNNKRLLHDFLKETGLPVVEGEAAASPEEVPDALRRLRTAGFSEAVVKSALGASGIGLLKIPSLDETVLASLRVPDHFFYEGAALVEGWLRPGTRGVSSVRSPSVQLFLDEDRLHLYDLTEQILSAGSVHEGNESPPPYLAEEPALREELLRQARVAGSWLHHQGYRGTASADFLVVEREDGHREVFVCELNARVTGATYPSVLARHFIEDGAWLLRNLRFETPLAGDEILGFLAKAGTLFVPGRTEAGVMPINFNFGRDGLVHKGQFLCLAHSSAGSHTLLALAELGLPCAPDRD